MVNHNRLIQSLSYIIAIISLLLIAGCAKTETLHPTFENDTLKHPITTHNKILTSEIVTLTSDDGTVIKGDFYDSGLNGIILIHMLDGNRKDWEVFAKELQKEGYSVLAIDLRGHGNSDGNWKEFGSAEFNNMTLDVKSAAAYLKGKGKVPYSIIGASIGANLALKESIKEEISRAVLLSPGLNYRGINIERDSTLYGGRVLIVVSADDKYAYESSTSIYNNLPGKKEIITLKGGSHGTTMLLDSKVRTAIISWLKEAGPYEKISQTS